MYHIPFAFWLVKLLRPQLLVELGSYYGASFCAFCQQIERLNISCEAYAVDLWRGDEHMGQYGEEVYEDLRQYVLQRYGSFASLLRMSFNAASTQFQEHSIDLLHMDGSHSEEAIIHDFEAWLPKISARGIVLIHDICSRFPGYGGVQAWKILSDQYSSLAFLHGYGLGVLIVGDDAPKELREIAGSPNVNEFAKAFEAQGKIYGQLFALEDQRKQDIQKGLHREQDLNKTIESLHTLLDNERREHAQEAGSLRESAASLKEGIFKLREDLLREQLKNETLENSRSWRITAPLRRLAHFFRAR